MSRAMRRTMKRRMLPGAVMLATAAVVLAMGSWAAGNEPLKTVKSVPLPALHDGDFDHFAVDLAGKRLFSAAEENSKVLVFDLESGALLHTIDGLKAPHSMAYRSDLRKLFVVDGDLGVVRMYDGRTYKDLGDIQLRLGADSSTYDPATKYMYVIDGGRDAHLPNCYLSVVDTTKAKEVADVPLDSNDVEAVVLEKTGPRMFVVIRGNNAIEVFNRRKPKPVLLATWPLLKDATRPTAMAFDEGAHRLFIGTRNPGTLIVLDSNSGKVVASLPAASMVDNMAWDGAHKRIYFAGTEFLDVFQQRDPDHYELAGHIPTGFRAKTGIYVPQLDRYYLGIPHHENTIAELRIFSVVK
jgi:hypothetical protein